MTLLLVLACSDAPEAPAPATEEPPPPEAEPSPAPPPQVTAHLFAPRDLSGARPVVEGAEARRVEDYWVPATLDVSEGLVDRCIHGRDVRSEWPGQWAIWEVYEDRVARDGTTISAVGDGLSEAVRVDARAVAYDHRDVARWSACWPDLRALLVVHPGADTDVALRTLGSLVDEIDPVDVLVGGEAETPPAPFEPAIHPPPQTLPPQPVERLTPAEELQKQVLMKVISTPAPQDWCPDRITVAMTPSGIEAEATLGEGESVTAGTASFDGPGQAASWVVEHQGDGGPSAVRVILAPDGVGWTEILGAAATLHDAVGRPVEVLGSGGGTVEAPSEKGASLGLTDAVPVVTIGAPWSERACPSDLLGEDGSAEELDRILKEADGVKAD